MSALPAVHSEVDRAPKITADVRRTVVNQQVDIKSPMKNFPAAIAPRANPFTGASEVPHFATVVVMTPSLSTEVSGW
jgi:hypothetical protein